MKFTVTALPFILTVVFTVLKLCRVLSWSWWWIVSPLWIVMALVLVVVLMFVAVAHMAYRADRG